jgi:hypothetical protein
MTRPLRKILIGSIVALLLVPGMLLGWWTCRSIRAQGVLSRLRGGTDWEGTWESYQVGDGGWVRMRMSETVPGEYRTVWQIEHYGMFQAGFDEVIYISPGGSMYGSVNLGPVDGGVYRISGQAGIGEIKFRYDSSTDSGVVELHRVAGNENR